jgi:hypothetical protein
MADETYTPARRHGIRKSTGSRSPCHAKQSQFPAVPMKANCRSEKGLGKEVWMTPPGKTKPICPAGLAPAVPVRALVETQNLTSLRRDYKRGPSCKTKPICGGPNEG